jgi:hypothetical protein
MGNDIEEISEEDGRHVDKNDESHYSYRQIWFTPHRN